MLIATWAVTIPRRVRLARSIGLRNMVSILQNVSSPPPRPKGPTHVVNRTLASPRCSSN